MHGQRLLVVEDNPGDARLCRELLKDSRLVLGEVVCVERLSEALQRLTRETFGVILFDLKLPDAEGLQGLSAILQESPRTPVVVLTGNADEDLAIEALKLGAQDYLVKGRIDAEDLRRSIRYAVEREMHREAVAALQTTEERLREVVANAPIILFTENLQGEITLMEGRGAEALGLKPGQGIGRTLHEIFGDGSADGENVRSEVLSGRAVSGTFRSKERVFDVHLAPQRNDGGAIVGAIGVATDITEKALAEERFKRAFHAAPYALVITTARDGVFVDVNSAFAHVLGYERHELLGKSSLEVRLWVEPEDRARFVRQIQEHGRVTEYPTTFRTKAGELRSFMVSTEAFNLDGRPCLIGSIRDVTEWKELQRKLVENERLASTGQFAGFVAHQLNTPLTNIALLTSSLERRIGDQSTREKLEKIDAQRRIAGSILADLMSFARQGELRLAEADLRDVIDRSCSQVEPFRRPAVSLVREVPSRPVLLRIDAPKLEEALLNLLKNAFEATESGSVTVALHDRGESVALSVADTGAGIPPENVARLFQPFFTTKTGARGTGLGLPLCRTVVEAHGGRVEVATEVGKGSSFTMLLPRRERPA